MSQHLLGEERVAVGALDDRRRERSEVVVQLAARLGRQHRLHAVAVEPAQREAFDPRPAVEVSQHPAEGVLAVDLGVPVGAEHAETLVGAPSRT